MEQEGGKRRIDRITRPEFLEGLAELPIEELRRRRDESRAEVEYLSLLRRLLQGRAEILKAEIERRHGGGVQGPLVERLATILAEETSRGPSRGEAVRVGVPEPVEEELLLARRRVERLVADAGISDPSALDDERLSRAVDILADEEQEVSGSRSLAITVLDALQDELKRRYKEDVSQVLGQ